jgi:CBS domain-containing protein
VTQEVAVAPITPHDPVRAVASHGAISVDERMSLSSLASVMREADVGAVVVRRADGSAGIVSERDIARALAADADPDWVWAADVMAEDIVIAELDEPIVDVALRMIEENVRHVVITDRDAVVGVVSMRDLLPVLVDEVTDLR